ncbi:MAG: asparagine--tRNA ligase [Clostridiaceae bacterium]|nr:asparagine--tRNA ligase [Clostridiaceae bacterium]
MDDRRLTIKEIFTEPERYWDEQVTVAGWLRNIRSQKQRVFADLNDGSCFDNLQITCAAEGDTADIYRDLSSLGVGSAVYATGIVTQRPDGLPELNLSSLAIEGESPPSYPLQPKRHTVEFLRTIAHLRPRTNLFSAVFRIRSEAAFALHKFFHERNFVYVHTPIITGSDSEGAGEMFNVTTLDISNPPRTEDGEVDYRQDFFHRHVNLTVSGQLNAECYAQAFAKIYTFGPTFRAENSNTPRHAAEFWMIEPEIAFADLDDDMELAEAMLRYVIKYVLENCSAEIAFLDRFVSHGLIKKLELVANSEFDVISYTDAIAELQKAETEFKYPVFWGADLQTEHERYLSEHLVGGPVFVRDYPREIKAFYMRLNEKDDFRTVAAMDCLVPGIGEIIGGSQREEREELLLERIKEFNLNMDEYWWYLELRRYGTTKHAGYGLGFERLIMYLTGVNNIRDVIPFPRTTGTAEF